MAIREIVVRDGEVTVKACGILTTQDLDIAQGYIYINQETTKRLQRQVFDFTEVEGYQLNSDQIFYIAAMDNSAVLANPEIEFIKIAPNLTIYEMCCEWHQNIIVRAKTRIIQNSE